MYMQEMIKMISNNKLSSYIFSRITNKTYANSLKDGVDYQHKLRGLTYYLFIQNNYNITIKNTRSIFLLKVNKLQLGIVYTFFLIIFLDLILIRKYNFFFKFYLLSTIGNTNNVCNYFLFKECYDIWHIRIAINYFYSFQI